MSNSRKTSAAIVGLLDAIKFEGIEPVDDTNIMPTSLSSNALENCDINLSTKDLQNIPSIPYQIKLIDTKLCKPWHLANRLQEYLTIDSCLDLIESLKKVGQQIPVLVRKSQLWDGYDLICGARRLFACDYLGIKIKAAIVILTDKEALLAMDAENRPRADISPYERACDYKRWVDMGIYKNYKEIMDDIGVKKSWFSQIMALADLHENIIKAFEHPANLKPSWGYELQLICKRDKSTELAMIQAASNLIGNSLPPSSVFKILKNVNSTTNAYKDKKIDWVTDSKGEKVFRVTYSKSNYPSFLFNKKLSNSLMDKIISNIRLIFDEDAEKFS